MAKKREIKPTPLEAFDRAMALPLLSSRRLDGPGAVIRKLSPDEREALCQLRSDDVADIAPWFIRLCVAPR